MPKTDPRVDDYIARAAPFAQPILARLRAWVHEACPSVEETLKWGMPSFQYGGGILCQMAAFKQHASFGFWKHAEVMGTQARDGMGSLGRLALLQDLPPKRALIAQVRTAMALNEAGAKTPRTGKVGTPRPRAELPDDLGAALKRTPAALAAYQAFSPSQQREYAEWITDAKRAETRARRIEQAVAWMAEGKARHWKYQKR
jgi:hypothetical protein